MTVRVFEAEDRAGVIAVWQRSGITRPWNDPDLDMDRKVAYDPEGFLVAIENGSVIGTVMAGYDGHRGWIQYMAVDPSYQRKGVGRALLEAATAILRGRGCPKINLQVRRTNREVVRFYEKAGFKEDEVLSMGLRLVEDDQTP